MEMQDLKQLISTLNAALNGGDDDGTGWGDAPSRSTIVYLSRQHGGRWYTWDHQTAEPRGISHEALTGHVSEAYLRDKEGPEGVSTKLRVAVDTQDGRWTLETGVNTIASRQLLKGLLQADPALPVTIVPKEADKESVLFVELWQDGSRIDIDYDDDRSGERLLVELCDALDIELQHYEIQQPTHAPQQAATAGRGQAPSKRIRNVSAKLERLDGDALADAVASLKTWQPDRPLSTDENKALADLIEQYEGPADDTFEPDDDLPF